MPTVSEFWDGRAQNYDAQVGTHYAEAYEKTAACFKKYLKPTDTVLDFACGTGIVTFAVAPSVQSVRAIDVSGEMVRRAQEKVKAQGVENVTVTQTDLFDGCLAEGSFNAVLACNVLLYIEDRSAALARIRALLKPQGTLLLVSDCLGEGLTRERVRKWFEYKTGKRPYVAFDTMRSLERSVTDAGFAVLERENLLSRRRRICSLRRKRYKCPKCKDPAHRFETVCGVSLLLLPAGNFVEQLSAIAERQLADQKTQQRCGKHVAREVDVQVQPRQGDEHRERNGNIAETPVGLRQDRCGDRRGQRVSRGERVVRRRGNQKLHGGIEPAGPRARNQDA